jgi:hypothetical protein
MAKFYKPITFVVALLLMKDSLAAYSQVAEGVLRVDLTKQYVPHQEYTELDLDEELDEKVQLTIENGSYQELRNI